MFDPDARIGAADIKDIRNHSYFTLVHRAGARFEGAQGPVVRDI